MNKSIIGYGLLFGTGILFNVGYYGYNNQTQVIVSNIDDTDIFVNEQGQYCKVFAPKEHVIHISRNDAYYHKIKEIPGYTIQEVAIHGWRDNNQTTYVNVVPVIAVATKDKNGQFHFNKFGETTVVLDEPKLVLKKD